MNRPFVFINVAMSADGKIDTVERQGAAISSSTDKLRVDELRASADAIMVGGHTALTEDPRLTVKSPHLRAQRAAQGKSENPIKVAVTTCASFRASSSFLNAGPARVVIFTTTQTQVGQVNALRSAGIDVIVCGEQRVDLVQALASLHDLGVQRLMVEGGATLNFELLRLGLVDELNVYVAPLIFGGASAPTLAAGAGWNREGALQLKLVETSMLDEDGGVLLRYAI